MKLKSFIIIPIFCFFLILIQTSFLVHFGFYGTPVNLILLLIIIINLLEDKKSNQGIYCALCGGFLLDIFSGHFMGFETLIALSLALLIKFVLKRYVRIPIFEEV